MKFNFKMLAAAVALVASAGANAAIPSSSTGTTTNAASNYAGGSDLVFFAWAGGSSFVQDLGSSTQLGNVIPSSTWAGQTNSYTIDTGAASTWDSFVTAAGSNSIQWGVMGVHKNTGVVNALGKNWVVSTATVGANVSLQKQNGIATAFTPFDTFAAAALPTPCTSSSATADNWATSLKSNFGGKLQFNNTNVVNSAPVSFYLLDTAGSSTSVASTNTVYGGTWTFDGTTAIYAAAPVPEPESMAMMLAGLALIGAVARRRARQQ